MIHSLLHTLSEPKMAFKSSSKRFFCGAGICFGRWSLIHRLPDNRRAAVVQERHRQIAHADVVIFQDEPLGFGELSDDRGFHVLALAEGVKFLPIRGRDGEHHPLLGFGNPNLRIRQPGVFQRSFVQPDLGSGVFAHLADRAAKTRRPRNR